MAANTTPIFPIVGKLAWAVLTTANTAKDGTGTVGTVFTAGSNGGRIEKLKIRQAGTNVATVLRVFLNNGSTNATAANNSLYSEVALPASTLSEVAAQADFEVFINVSVPSGYTVLVTLGTTVAGGIAVTGVGGDY
jgi:hypothetical protein